MSRHIYKPMLAGVAPQPFSDKDWIFEIKWDGFRAIAYIDEELSIKSRNENELKHNFPELAELRQLANGLVVDGEIVIMKKGKPDFQSLLERGQAVSAGEIQRQAIRAPVSYIVFDVLEKDDKPLINLPLITRKKILKESLREGSHVFLSDFIEEKGEAYYQLALGEGLEGVIAKKKDSSYEEGLRTGSWLKIKKLKTCDCVIFGYTKGVQSREKTFGALILGLYDKDGKTVYVGKVGTGFTEEMLGVLSDKFKKLKTELAPFRVEPGDRVTWLEPKLICEVAYQVVTRDIRLRMPRFRGLREDKSPAECTLDQLIENKKLDTADGDRLSEYSLKRNFEQTPEPKGGEKEEEKLIFVIQEHHARRLHYDLRLENGGVLKSWAVPKGMPESAGERRLAVETEDHPLEYASFEGVIPAGQYGAGTVKIWDKGHYVPKLWEDDKIEFTFNGERLKGRYVLVRLKKAKDDKSWLLLKGKE
ncbi:MAG: non-homologous end-joining DNA ligase [Candidatus Bathyarchaeia archaeon]|jgi:DNA ligase D-like protein (predicted ligase)/DNA ligase D-like protein (predicted 3'-phosphoesterase)